MPIACIDYVSSNVDNHLTWMFLYLQGLKQPSKQTVKENKC